MLVNLNGIRHDLLQGGSLYRIHVTFLSSGNLLLQGKHSERGIFTVLEREALRFTFFALVPSSPFSPYYRVKE